ncbi:MAG: arginase family protein [Ignavibacteriales bacterium]
MLDLILSEYAPPVRAGEIVDEDGSLGPRTLLNAGLLPSLSWAGVRVMDAAVIPGGLPPDDAGAAGIAVDERKRRLTYCTRQLAERIEYSIAQERLPLTLGDCTAGVGVFAGLKRRWDDVAVVWVDAHCDLNTEESTLTGYFGGMPLAAVLGESLPWLTAAAGMHWPCDEKRVALVGAREFDPYERDFLLGSGITRVHARN